MNCYDITCTHGVEKCCHYCLVNEYCPDKCDQDCDVYQAHLERMKDEIARSIAEGRNI